MNIGFKIFSCLHFSPVTVTDGSDINALPDVTYSQLTPVDFQTMQKCQHKGEDTKPQVYKFHKSRHYNQPIEDSKIEDLSVKKFVQNTDRKVHWCVNMYRQWCIQRNEIPGMERIVADLDCAKTLNAQNLIFALSRFIYEIHKLDNTEFPPKTVYDIIYDTILSQKAGFQFQIAGWI